MDTWKIAILLFGLISFRILQLIQDRDWDQASTDTVGEVVIAMFNSF